MMLRWARVAQGREVEVRVSSDPIPGRDEEWVIDRRGFPARVVLGAAEGTAARFLRAALSPLSLAYRSGVAVRNLCYDRGVFRSLPLPGPTISVGNLTLGGTGKTPMCLWVAERLMEAGRRPAILSRGYGAPHREGANDESAALERMAPRVPRRCDPDRVRAAEWAAVHERADSFILDDGFQHRHAARDLDIVLFDVYTPGAALKVFPAGMLREPLSALERADVVVITHSDLAASGQMAQARALIGRHAPGALIAEAEHRLAVVEAPRSGTSEPADALQGRRVMAFCGTGNPRSFVAALVRAGASVAAAIFYPDHYAYAPADLAEVGAVADRCAAEWIVTTLKDAVKVGPLHADPRFRIIMMALDVVAGEERLIERIHAAVQCREVPRGQKTP